MELLDIIKGFINIIIPIVITALIQIVKTLLDNKGIRFKSDDTWVWIVLALGLPMAILDYGIKAFVGFNIFNFILLSFSYSATSAFVYKLWKVGGKKISELFGKGKE